MLDSFLLTKGQEFLIRPILDSEIFNCLNSIISLAEEQIYIGTPWIGDVGYLLDTIKQKSKEGVEVKILTRPLNKNENSFNYKKEILINLRNGGCCLYFNERIHFKLYVVDNFLLSTSANLTPTAMLRNHEIGILINEKNTVSILKNYLLQKIEISQSHTNSEK